MDGIGIGGGGGALLGCLTSGTSVCVDIETICRTSNSTSIGGGGGGALVGETGVLGGLRGPSRVCDAEETIELSFALSRTRGAACTRFRL